MNSRLKMILRLVFIFIFSFLVLEFIAYPIANGDPIANYCFSHALVMGEIPYKDFNLISTPLYTFIMSIGLLVFDNYLIFILEQSILITILFYFLFKMYDEKTWFILLSMALPLFYPFSATYNFLCLFFIILIVYFEKNYPDKDYLIGLLIGLASLSKHTTGLFLLIPLIIIYYKDLRKLLKRFIGILIPVLIFLIYLIITKSLFNFIDLSFLGLFDFAGNNTNLKNIYLYLILLVSILLFSLIIKNKKKKYNYYFLVIITICIPLFDLIHFSLLFVSFIIVLLDNIKIKNNLYITSIIVLILFSSLYFICINTRDALFYKDVNHFNYMYNLKYDYLMNKKTFNYFDRYKDRNNIILSSHTMMYDITRDNNINYFDVLLYGNSGYNGTKKLIRKMNKEKNLYIIVDMNKYEESINNKKSQYDTKVIDYVLNNYKLIEEEGIFRVYYKK